MNGKFSSDSMPVIFGAYKARKFESFSTIKPCVVAR
jgi:hypothetical protein